MYSNFNIFQSHQTHLFLQGADKLYVNLGSGGLTKVYQMSKPPDSNKDRVTVTSTLVESKQWVIVPLPATYLSTNWPARVRYIQYLLLYQRKSFFYLSQLKYCPY